MTSLASKARAASALVDYAEWRHLPMPRDVSVADYYDEVRVSLSSAPEVRQWAVALGSSLAMETVDDGTLIAASGELLDVKVRAFHVMPAVGVAS